VIEIKHNSVSLHWNCYAYIQLIRGRFWLQLWTVKKLSEPRVSWKYLAKRWKNSKNAVAICCNAWTDGAYLGGRRCVGRVHSVVYNASAVTRGAGHMLREKSQRTQNGTMFVNLDWPLNASRRLSASAELLVIVKLQKNLISKITRNLTPDSYKMGRENVIFQHCLQ